MRRRSQCDPRAALTQGSLRELRPSSALATTPASPALQGSLAGAESPPGDARGAGHLSGRWEEGMAGHPGISDPSSSAECGVRPRSTSPRGRAGLAPPSSPLTCPQPQSQPRAPTNTPGLALGAGVVVGALGPPKTHSEQKKTCLAI